MYNGDIRQTIWSLATRKWSLAAQNFVGVSRSASVVLAYLMRKEKISLDEALIVLASKRSLICPNPGFLRQLRMFEHMGCTIDPADPEYRDFMLHQMARVTNEANTVPANAIEAYTETMATCNANTWDIYRCRRCRFELFKSQNLRMHPAQHKAMRLEWRWRNWRHVKSEQREASNADEMDRECNRSLFIEPVTWMHETITTANGKLQCPRCAAKLGSFDWAGDQCSCGAWVTPSFHIQPTKVDKIPHTGLAIRPSNVCSPQQHYL